MAKDKDRKIAVPLETMDALLANILNRNWHAVESIGQTLRELAEDQAPDRFKSHRNVKYK